MKITTILTLAWILIPAVAPNSSSAAGEPAAAGEPEFASTVAAGELEFASTVVAGEPEFASTRPGKDFALFFAVQNYKNPGLRPLQNPIKNAEAIAAVLKSQYGFDTLIVRNPTYDDIERKLKEYKEKFAQGRFPDDGQLLIFFSGHGDRELKNGFFLPTDAVPGSLNRTAIPYSYWREWIDEIDCKHILVCIDACFSGTFDPNWYNKPGSTLGKRSGELSEKQKLLAEHELYTTRWFFTSGTEVETPDQSNFAAKLLEALRSRGGDDHILTASETWTYLERASPRPWQGEFGKNERLSSFLFIDQKPLDDFKPHDPTAADRLAKDLAAWKTAKDCGTIACYQAYLNDFHDGEFNSLANDEIRRLNEESKRRQEDTAWEIAKEKKTIDGYDKYKRDYPNGRYLAEADRRIAELKNAQNDTTNKGSTASYPPGFEYLASDMVLIPGGEFDMGDNYNDPEAGSDEKPVHRVKVNSFYLCRYEVTQAQWRAVMGSNPSYFKDCDNCPVEQVSWNDVQEYLKKLNQKTGGNFRLPTEAEWEYAAREKGRKVRFGNGKDTADPKEMNFDGSASYKKSYSVAGEYRSKTVPVNSFLPNALGLYNMSGNVWEWCSDWYDENYYKQFDGKTADNPKGPTSGSSRVCRGGSWDFNPYLCRVAFRFWPAPDDRRDDFGIRVAQDR